MSVAHHGDEEVEHEQGGDDGKGSVGHAVHEGQVHVIVGRAVNDTEEKLKGAEQCCGEVIEFPQLARVLCLEDNIEGCSAQEKGMEMRKKELPHKHSIYLQHISPYTCAHAQTYTPTNVDM